MFKINTHLFTAAGPEAVRRIGKLGPGIFLDLKFHDIPNTVYGAVTEAARMPDVRLIDLHTTGDIAMMRAGAEALAKIAGAQRHRPQLLGITVLTSLDAAGLARVGISGSPAGTVVKLARLAKKSGLDGVVASPQEVRRIRRACGPDFLIVVPGVRSEVRAEARPDLPQAPKPDDQARVATPGDAIRAGADYLVVGRPITAAADPESAAQAIVAEIADAMSERLQKQRR